MRTKQATGVAPRSRIPAPSYPTKILGGLAFSLSMGLAASCGGDPGYFRYDAAGTTDARTDGPDGSAAPRSDAAVDATAVDGGAEGLDAGSE